MDKKLIGYQQALQITMDTISPVGKERVSLSQCCERVVFANLYSQVDSPSMDASMKDGYALRSADIEFASQHNSLQLKVVGTAAAGGPCDKTVGPGTTIRILTGATIPEGADAVLSEEFAERKKDRLLVFNTAEPRRNILARGTDVAKGELIATAGQRLSPGLMGMLAAAGYAILPAYRQPKVAILATGDELVVPGLPLAGGKLYASNLEMLKAWCLRYGFHTNVAILRDHPETITRKLSQVIKTHDAVITSGGAWTGDRDFVGSTLDALEWKKMFHRIRIGPGKAVGFGLLEHKPVFLLPGGPPSNFTGFLQIALPGLLKLGGYSDTSLFTTMVKLAETVKCRNENWTEFIYGHLKIQGSHMVFKPFKPDSRLKSIAGAQGVVMVPEGVKSIPANTIVPVQVLM
jgi:molybdopterin molybdotransferase